MAKGLLGWSLYVQWRGEAAWVPLKDTWLMTLFHGVMRSDCWVQESKHLVKLDQNHTQVRQGEAVQISSARSQASTIALCLHLPQHLDFPHVELARLPRQPSVQTEVWDWQLWSVCVCVCECRFVSGSYAWHI